MRYDVRAKIEPTGQKVAVSLRISELPPREELVFHLHKDMVIEEITGQSGAVDYVFNRDGEPAPYVLNSRPLIVRQAGDELTLRYSGTLTGIEAGVNMVTEDLIELAVYAAWHPLPPAPAVFQYALDFHLPAGYRVASNGRMVSVEDAGGDEVVHHIESYSTACFDIALVASPLLEKEELDTEGLRVELLYPRSMPEVREGKLELMEATYRRLLALFGPLDTAGFLRFVYSPRDGWGYSRLPLIVVSAERDRDALSDSYAHMMRQQLDIVHELAHFWLSVADAATTDDWINEGCVEYIAYRLACEQFGEGYGERRLRRYLDGLAGAQTTDAIVDTDHGSPDRELNWYVKPTLMFLEAERSCGFEGIVAFFRQLIAERRAVQQAITTEVFLDVATRLLGRSIAGRFRERLTAAGWDPVAIAAVLT